MANIINTFPVKSQYCNPILDGSALTSTIPWNNAILQLSRINRKWIKCERYHAENILKHLNLKLSFTVFTQKYKAKAKIKLIPEMC